ncbi:MAG: hypothetical protein KDD35_11155 [Bdellovibrionales bacterium]|nr:hypothetical protein [Bdellovibrionales bacterium]
MKRWMAFLAFILASGAMLYHYNQPSGRGTGVSDFSSSADQNDKINPGSRMESKKPKNRLKNEDALESQLSYPTGLTGKDSDLQSFEQLKQRTISAVSEKMRQEEMTSLKSSIENDIKTLEKLKKETGKNDLYRQVEENLKRRRAKLELLSK